MKTKDNWHVLCVSTLERSMVLDIFKCVILFGVLFNATKLVCLALWFFFFPTIKETELVKD